MPPRACAVVLLAAAALALAACRKKPTGPVAVDAGPPAPDASGAALPPTASAPSTPPPEKPFTFPPAGAPGPAYFDTLGALAYILEDGTAGIIKGGFETLALGADGRVYAAGLSSSGGTIAISRVDGKVAKVVARSTEPFSTMAIGADARIHVAAVQKGVRTYDPATRKWTTTDPGIRFVEALRTDPRGRLWALGKSDLAYLDGAQWKAVPKPNPSAEYKGFAVVKDRLFVLGFQQVYEVQSDVLVPVGPTYVTGAAHVASASNGLVAIPAFDPKATERSLLLLDVDGGTKAFESTPENGLLDSSGRRWTIDDGELVVRSLADGTSTSYPVGSLPILDEFTAGFMLPRRGLVVGAGPKLPPVGAVRTVPSLRGKIVIGGKPVAGGTVEICRDAAYAGAPGASPCAGKKSRLTATTSAAGEFAFTDVPLGRYDLALQIGDKWTVDHLSEVGRMTSGKALDLGTIRYK